MTEAKKGTKLTGLLTKEELMQICDLTSEEFDYHIGLLMESGLVNCYVEK